MNYPIAAYRIDHHQLDGYEYGRELMINYFWEKLNTIHNWEIQSCTFPYVLLIYDYELLENENLFLDIIGGILIPIDFYVDRNFVKHNMPYGKERRHLLLSWLFQYRRNNRLMDIAFTDDLKKDPDIKYLLKKKKLKIINIVGCHGNSLRKIETK